MKVLYALTNAVNARPNLQNFGIVFVNIGEITLHYKRPDSIAQFFDFAVDEIALLIHLI